MSDRKEDGIASIAREVRGWATAEFYSHPDRSELDAMVALADRTLVMLDALVEIARLRTELKGDFSRSSAQSDIARVALAKVNGEVMAPDGFLTRSYND